MALPYALCALVDPLAQLPTLAFRLLGVGQGTSLVVPGAVLLLTGLITYGGLTAAALHLVRCRALVLRRTPDPADLALAA
ncbi:MAG: hypothetical protein ACRYG2_03735 [Janthinobacterium lividum]